MRRRSRSKRQLSWKDSRPLWFRLNRLGRVIWILSLLVSSILRKKWRYEPERVQAIILVRDIHSTLEGLVNALVEQGIAIQNIVLLDTGTTSEAAVEELQRLQSTGCQYLRLDAEEQTYGPYAPWMSRKVRHMIARTSYPYIVTDPDIRFPETISQAWLYRLLEAMNSYRSVSKVALPLSLKEIDVDERERIKLHERQLARHWMYKSVGSLMGIEEMKGVICSTDTTLALYRPNQWFSTFSIRLSEEYEILHMPWYKGFIKTVEYLYYQEKKLKVFGEWSTIVSVDKGDI